MRVNIRITNWCYFKVTFIQRMPKHSAITHTHTQSHLRLVLCVRSPPQGSLLLCHTRNATQLGDRPNHHLGLNCRHISETQRIYRNWFPNFTSRKTPKYKRRKMETAKPILSYFRHLQRDKIGARPSQKGAEGQGKQSQQGASFFPTFLHFF